MRRHLRARRGMALLNVLVFALISVAAISAGSQYFSNTIRASRKTNYDEQTYNIALAGIQHAIAWLNRQDIQPVEAFDPHGIAADDQDAADTPLKDEALGLTGELVVDADRKLKARYEVGRSPNAPNRDALATGTALPSYLAGLPAIYPSVPGITWFAKDLGPSRGGAPGSVWRLRCRAYLWDGNQGEWGVAPPLKDLILEADIERRTLKPYAASVYHWGNGVPPTFDVRVSNTVDVSVANGTAGSYWTHLNPSYPGPGTPVQTGTGNHIADNLPASPSYVSPNVQQQMEQVLGIRDEGLLEGLATHYFEGQADLPARLEGRGVFYIKGGADFGGACQLDASGVLIVGGPLKINRPGSQRQRFMGVVMALGGADIKGPVTISGSLISGGTLKVLGDTGATASIRYHGARVDEARAVYDEYKLRHSTLKVLNALSGD